jgi:uncharacterized protein (DUF58 family)
VTTDNRAWRPTPALARALAVSAVFLLVAVLFRQRGMLVIAAPLIVGTVLGLLRRPHGEPEVRVHAHAGSMLENQAFGAAVVVATTDSLDAVAIHLRTSPWLVPRDGPLQRCVSVLPGQRREVTMDLRATRWGRHQVGPAQVEAVGAHGLLRCGPLLAEAVTVTVLPLREGFDATDTMPQAKGMVGPHRSRSPGEGSDIAGVRPFVPGDRLRRINWPVSLRAGGLHVVSTYSDRDTDVMLVLDTQYDFGETDGVGDWSSSLDTTVRASASIAEHYLRHGDRVGLIDLGQAVRRVRPGAGRGHLTRILDVLLDTEPARSSGVIETLALGEIASAALVVLLSPLVGEAALARAAAIGRGGHTVAVIDTLPPNAVPPSRSAWTDLAWRLWLIERAVDIGRLHEIGIPVVPWRGAGSLDEVLRGIGRAAAAPRAVR